MAINERSVGSWITAAALDLPEVQELSQKFSDHRGLCKVSHCSAKYNHTKDLPIMKFHRHVKKIECALTVNRNFCQNNADFGNNVSDLLRELIRFLAAEEVQNIKVGWKKNKKNRLSSVSDRFSKIFVHPFLKSKSTLIWKSGKFQIKENLENWFLQNIWRQFIGMRIKNLV